jgi:hypothetical protein
VDPHKDIVMVILGAFFAGAVLLIRAGRRKRSPT